MASKSTGSKGRAMHVVAVQVFPYKKGVSSIKELIQFPAKFEELTLSLEYEE